MHLNDEQIQRYLHGEADAASKAELVRHIHECQACARLIEDAEREEEAIFGLLREIDHPAPAVEAGDFFLARHGLSGAWGRRVAAAAIVVTVAGAAYAIPGSPVRELAKRVVELITGHNETLPAVPAAPGAGPVTSGISVPAGEFFTVHFTSEQAHGTAVVIVTGGNKVAVRALGGSARFTTDSGQLTIENSGSDANYEIDVPRSVRRFEVTVGTASALVFDADSLAKARIALPLGPAGTQK